MYRPKDYHAGGYSDHSPIMEYHPVRRIEDAIDRRERDKRVDGRYYELVEADRRVMERPATCRRASYSEGKEFERKDFEGRTVERSGIRESAGRRELEYGNIDRREIARRDMERREMAKEELLRREIEKEELVRREMAKEELVRRERLVKGRNANDDYAYTLDARDRIFSRDGPSHEDQYEVEEERRILSKRPERDVNRGVDEGVEFVDVRKMEEDRVVRRQFHGESRKGYGGDEEVRAQGERIREYDRRAVRGTDEHNSPQELYQNSRVIDYEDVYYGDAGNRDRRILKEEEANMKEDARWDKRYTLGEKAVDDNEQDTLFINRQQRAQVLDYRYYSDEERPRQEKSKTYHYKISNGKDEGNGYGDSRKQRGYKDEQQMEERVRVKEVRGELVNDATLKADEKENYDVKKENFSDETIVVAYRGVTKAEVNPSAKLSTQPISYYTPFDIRNAPQKSDKEESFLATFIGLTIFENETDLTNKAEKVFSDLSAGFSIKQIEPSKKNLHLTSDSVAFAAPNDVFNRLIKYMPTPDPNSTITRNFKSKNFTQVIHPLDAIKSTGTHGRKVFYYITEESRKLVCWAFQTNDASEDIERVVNQAISKESGITGINKTGNGVPLQKTLVSGVKTGQSIRADKTENRETVAKQTQNAYEYERSQKVDSRAYRSQHGENRVVVGQQQYDPQYSARNEIVVKHPKKERGFIEYSINENAPVADRHVATHSKYYDDSPSYGRNENVAIKQVKEVDRTRNYPLDDTSLYTERVVTYTKPQLQEQLYRGRYDGRSDEPYKSKATSVEHAKIIFTESDDEVPYVETSRKLNPERSTTQNVSNYYTLRSDSPRKARKAREVELYSLDQPRIRSESFSNVRRLQGYVDERAYKDTYVDGMRRKQAPLTVYTERNDVEAPRTLRNSTLEHNYHARSKLDVGDESVYNRTQKKGDDRATRYQSDYRLTHTLEPQHAEYHTSGPRSSTEIECLYLGMVRVNKIRGTDEVDNAIEFLKNATSSKNWQRVVLEISQARICVFDHKNRDEMLHMCNLRHLSYAGISSRNNKFGGFIVAGGGIMLGYVFYIEPNASRFYRAISNALVKYNDDVASRSRVYSR